MIPGETKTMESWNLVLVLSRHLHNNENSIQILQQFSGVLFRLLPQPPPSMACVEFSIHLKMEIKFYFSTVSVKLANGSVAHLVQIF